MGQQFSVAATVAAAAVISAFVAQKLLALQVSPTVTQKLLITTEKNIRENNIIERTRKAKNLQITYRK